MTFRRLLRRLRTPLLLLVTVPFLVPLLWTLSYSLRPLGLGGLRQFEWLPGAPAWTNYQQVFELVPMGRYLLNTAVISGLSVPICLLVASWAGFALAQLPRQWRTPLVLLSLAMVLIPGPALWLPRYILFTRLGLRDTIWPLVAPAFAGVSPVFVLLLYWCFRRIPADLVDAARAEGASMGQIWRTVGLPQARPMLVTVGLLTFVTEWNDFVEPMLFLTSPDKLTVSVGLHMLQQMFKTYWPILMAASVVAIAPVLALYLGAQRHFLHHFEPDDIGS